MAKKKEIKQIFENMDLESSEANPNPEGEKKDQAVQSDPASGEDEKLERGNMSAGGTLEPARPTDGLQEIPQGMVPSTGQTSTEQTEPESGDDSQDDLLEDVRKSLLEEEAQEEKKEHKWWRFGKSSHKKDADDQTSTSEEINLPPLAAVGATEAEAESVSEPDNEYQEQLEELIDMLDAEEEPIDRESAIVPSGTEVHPEPEPQAEPERPRDIDELKKQAFQSRNTEAEAENIAEVRSIALEGDEEVFVEVESKPPDQLEERLDAVENALKPYQRYLNFAFAFLGIVMAIVAIFLIYNAYQRSVARAAPTEIPSDLPFPSTVALPGGWQFSLGKGSLTADGSWNPSGAEWLQGTEVCRWVALPWSRQLEAVIRTLNPDDPIELGMSNNDKLTYNVYSVRQMSPAEMLKLDSNKPCLLIVLAEPNAEKRWVLTALP